MPKRPTSEVMIGMMISHQLLIPSSSMIGLKAKM